MKIPIFMIFKFVTIIGMWATKALEDGKITAAEGLELIAQLAEIIGVPLELTVPPEVTKTIEDIAGESEFNKLTTDLSKPDFESPK